MASFALYLANRTLAVRNALVVQYMPLLKAVVAAISRGRINRGDQSYVCVADLEAAGAAGLIRGVETYDALRGVKPETYLSHKIRSAVLDELRRLDPLSRADRKLLNEDRETLPAARRKKIEAGVRLGSAVSMSPAVEESLSSQAVGTTVKESLRAAFYGIRPRDVYALVLYQLEGMTLREVQAALSRKAVVTYVSERTHRILRTPPNDLRRLVSEGADKKGTHAKADLEIVATLKRGGPRTRRADDAVHPGAGPRPRPDSCGDVDGAGGSA